MALAIALGAGLPVRAHAEEPPSVSTKDAPVRYEIDAKVDRERATVTTRGRITFEDSPPDSVSLWLYGDRTSAPPPSMTDLTFDRLFPGGVSTGGYAYVTTRVEGCAPRPWPVEPRADPVKGRLLRVSICETARRPIVIHFEAELHLPRRYGTLGATSDALVLGDPWYPLVMSDAGVPVRGDHRIDLAWTYGMAVTARGAARGRTTRVESTFVSHVPVAITDAQTVHEEVFAGVRITLVTDRGLASAEAGRTPEGFELRDPWDIDAAGATLDTLRKCIALMRGLGFVADDPSAPADPRARRIAPHLVAVELPERERIAVALPGMLVTSDRAFRILPLERITRFHRLAIARRVFAELLAPRLERIEPIADRAWVADLDGSLLTDLMIALESEGRDRPEDLIGFAGFHPAVDNLLYAPKVAFRSAYFHDIEERDPDRDGSDRAFNQLPFGHLVLEKLRDRVGPPVARALTAHIIEGAPLRETVTRSAGRDLTTFFRTWLGPIPRLAYRIASHESVATGATFRHRVVVERMGATWVHEPVVVELVDRDGARERRVWDAPGPRGTVEWTSNAKLVDATVDPEGRLVQDPALAEDHPRFDDEIRHAWRPPIFNSFAVTLSVAEKRPDAVLDFVLKRRYDVRQWFGVSAATSARGLSGGVRYARGIGRMRDLNSTLGAGSISLSALRSETGFGGKNVPVSELDVGVNAGFDTRIEAFNPRHGWGVAAAVGAGAAREDAASGRAASIQPSASAAVRGEGVYEIHPRHVLAGALGAGATVCPALAQQLQALSGRSVLRAYAADELIGCSAAYAIAEYRLLAVSGLYLNGAHVAWFKGLQLVPFAAGGLLSSRSDLLFEKFYGEVGGGVRTLVDWGGVQPGLFAVDLGIPLSRSRDTYLDADGFLRRRPSYGLYVAFQQAL